jgi:hypothetical protein
MTGGWVSTYPDMVKEIYSRGHDLGNHSRAKLQGLYAMCIHLMVSHLKVIHAGFLRK